MGFNKHFTLDIMLGRNLSGNADRIGLLEMESNNIWLDTEPVWFNL